MPGIRMDLLLFGDRIRKSGIPIMVAPNTALSFLLAGVSMLLAGRSGRRTQLFRQVTVVILLFLVYFSVLGYIFDIPAGYRIGGLTPMALITALNFLLFLPGLLFADTRFGVAEILSSPLRGGRLMRLMVPFTMVFPPFIGYLMLEGERMGLYPGEVGVQLTTIVLTITMLFAISYYAALNIKKERSEHEIVTLMMVMSEGVMQLDKVGDVIFCNPAFEEIMGYTEKELIGRPPTDILISAKGKEAFLKRIEDRKKGIQEQYVSELRTKEGKNVHLNIKSKPLFDEHDCYNGVLISIRDVTEEILTMEDLKAFSASAAHDLKSPLAMIESVTSLFDMDKLDDDQQQLITFISTETKRMGKLLEDLLIYSKMGTVELPLTQLDVNEIVSEVSQPFGERPVKFIVEDLPPVTANGIAVKQLLRNLISNAVKYSSKAASPVVKIDSYEERGRTWFSVSDNGIGMDASQMDGLFTPFKRFTSEFEGNGLGLVIVKRIVERHGGEIHAAKNDPSGLAFHFTLSPLGQAA
ncbi:ATP-binding protein [Daejeonella sp.]|uniref:sensor histidine kinase n=1 Tax=Daejeonella sp. TaxID=2805397 RepID=UPI0030C63F4C